MKILALVQNTYGHKIIDYLKNKIPKNWSLNIIEVPNIEIEKALDLPEAVKLENLTKCDLILSLCTQPSIPLILPNIAKKTGSKALIVAIDDPKWVLGPRMELQIKRDLSKIDVECIFPRPFCALEKVGNKYIDSFAKLFGKPKIEIISEDNIIKNVLVKRGAPCGSTEYVAENLKGTDLNEAEKKAALLIQGYPCLASTEWDSTVNETLIHVAAYNMKEIMQKAI